MFDTGAEFEFGVAAAGDELAVAGIAAGIAAGIVGGVVAVAAAVAGAEALAAS